MDDRYQRRVLKLRNHVLNQEAIAKEKNFIEDFEEAFDLAIRENIEKMKVEELKELAKARDIKDYSKMKKEELIAALAGE